MPPRGSTRRKSKTRFRGEPLPRAPAALSMSGREFVRQLFELEAGSEPFGLELRIETQTSCSSAVRWPLRSRARVPAWVSEPAAAVHLLRRGRRLASECVKLVELVPGEVNVALFRL